ncbi:prepilin-type N-terminal cleavage/methylation domain-containing protein [Oceanobacillus sp. Castelsardo]|uniref:type IV pilus modification PilV family protein n=1 Tax=Oceanobacillus sp. Castelsardo TaxID=1851204 RepID=UPI000837CC84|nr:type II secretion system protein [Oceanobacillus sp. Castelsardo]
MYLKFKKINSKGFTLIEIIASITILSIIVLVLMPFFPQMMSWNQNTEDELIASNLLSQVAYEIQEKEADSLFGSKVNKKTCDNENYTTMVSYPTKNSLFSAELKACREDVDLYRTEIIIYNSKGEPISKSFTYISGDQNDEITE